MTLAAADVLAEAAATVPAADATRDRILDAALQEAAAVGLARLTVEDVVRRSGLGRMTVYRRFERRDALLDALAVRETRRFLEAVAAATTAEDAFVAGMRFVRAHPLLRRMAEDDPGAVISAVAAGDRTILALGSAFIAERLHGNRGGRPSRRTRWTAEALARLFVTYIAIPPVDPDIASDADLHRFARDVLGPLTSGAS
jgi:AcrR family transcriptional regulator